MTSRPGAVLLEVMVALVILSVALTACLTLGRQAVAAVERAHRAHGALRLASNFLDAVALWPRQELEQRLGERAQGDWRLVVHRPNPRLFVVAVTDSTANRVLVTTSLYRP
jgi:type II secretory pathway pseudopilin PulG